MLDSNLFASALAKLINHFGNDETHYENLFRVKKEDAIKYIDTLCVLMTSKIIATKANEKLTALD